MKKYGSTESFVSSNQMFRDKMIKREASIGWVDTEDMQVTLWQAAYRAEEALLTSRVLRLLCTIAGMSSNI